MSQRRLRWLDLGVREVPLTSALWQPWVVFRVCQPYDVGIRSIEAHSQRGELQDICVRRPRYRRYLNVIVPYNDTERTRNGSGVEKGIDGWHTPTVAPCMRGARDFSHEVQAATLFLGTLLALRFPRVLATFLRVLRLGAPCTASNFLRGTWSTS